jgi:polysaccharide export outer membrane protein
MRLFLKLFLLSPIALSAQNTPDFSQRNARYLLQPTDVLEIKYRYTPEFNQTVTIQPDGFCNLDLTGDLKLRGLTVEQARDVIATQAARRLKDPEITVALKEFEKPYFVVGGEVGHPGRFELRGVTSPIEAIAIAGGFKVSSRHSQVILYRRVGPDLGEAKVLNLKAPMNTPVLEAGMDIHSGDVLVVPQNTISKIERFVKWANIGLAWNPLAP